jgi:hypothetical protein
MIQIILGDYKYNKIKMSILSDKNYINTQIITKKNNIIIEKLLIDIYNYEVNQFIIDNITIKNEYDIELYYNDIIIDSIHLDIKTDPYDEVIVLNCDSGYGYEMNTWNKIKLNSKIIIHAGDQIYNDLIFFKYYYKKYYLKDKFKINEKHIYKEIYKYYLEHFSRNNKSEVLKSNFNIMIPDDHEIVDNDFFKSDIDIYNKISEIFKKISNDIQMNLKFDREGITYIEDNKHNTIYVLNYNEYFSEELIKKYKFEDKINNYKNVIIISRKNILESNDSYIKKKIYGPPVNQNPNIDYILRILIKQIDNNNSKNVYILCGDEHVKFEDEIYYKDSIILKIKACGSINTVVDMLYNNNIIKTDILDIKLVNKSRIYENGYILITYNKIDEISKIGEIKVEDIINKKRKRIHYINSIISGLTIFLHKIYHMLINIIIRIVYNKIFY